MTDLNPQDACQQMIASLNQEHSWGLDPLAQERYVVALMPHLDGLPVERWQKIALNFHHEHALVLALSNASHPEHRERWEKWCATVIAMLRHNGQGWAQDCAMDIDDLSQVARLALMRALPSYKYQSRFSSWAYSVIQRSVRDHIRASRAQRRSGHSSSLEDLPDAAHPKQPSEQHVDQTQANALAEKIAAILQKHPDQRLLTIFMLWAMDGHSSAEIGAMFSLHESRVRALLKLARDLLRNHPDIQAWIDTNEHEA